MEYSAPLTKQFLSNIEIEEAVLGSILLDSNAIYQVAETLPVKAFTVSSHQEIYQACLAVYKQQRPVDALSVTSWLADKDRLLSVGGRNKMANLVGGVVTTVNIDYLADALIEKYVRRQLDALGEELQQKSRDTEKPLAWTLENVEQRVLGITQLRNAKSSGYWQKIDDVAFERLCKELEDIEAIENAAHQDWMMRKLAKKWKFSNKKELLDFHAKWLDSQNKTQTYSAKEYFEKYGHSDQDWLIPGFVPAQSVIVLYADGGVGKTRLAFSLAKSAVSGGVFAYEGTEFNPMNTLLIETDQGPRNTSKLLEMQDFLSDEVSPRMTICDDWSVGEFGKLKKMLDNHKPKLVIVDSLTSISVDSIYSETDAEYARPLVRLRHIAKDYNCSFLIIHHTNAGGDMRGSRAIRNTVDEVWKFTKQQNEVGTFNVLTIDKTRSRGPGSYKFTYDDESWGWVFGGRLEDDVLGAGQASGNTMMQCIRFLNQHKGIPFEAVEVAESTGLHKDTVRRELKRAASEGLVNTGRSARDRRAIIYYLGNRLLSNITSDRSDRSRIELPITFFPMQDKDSGRCDRSDRSNSDFSIVKTKKISDQIDQIDHIDLKPLENKGKIADRRSDQGLSPSQVLTEQQAQNATIKTTDTEINRETEKLCPRTGLPLPSDFSDKIDNKTTLFVPIRYQEDNRTRWKITVEGQSMEIAINARGKDDAIAQLLATAQKFINDKFPWKPDTGKSAMYGGELVQIVGFNNHGREFQIELASKKMMYVKASQLEKPD